MNDQKLVVLIVLIIFSAMFIPLGISEYQKGVCKQEAMKMKYTSSEIQVICK